MKLPNVSWHAISGQSRDSSSFKIVEMYPVRTSSQRNDDVNTRVRSANVFPLRVMQNRQPLGGQTTGSGRASGRVTVS
jgi:hypothetical protein